MQEPDEAPAVVAPEGWKLGRQLAIGGTAIVHELIGASPAILKWARWRGSDIRMRFGIEADVMRLVGPPTTPQLIDHGMIEKWPYIVMEYVSGETLATWMSRAGARGGIAQIVAILTYIANSLGALHSAGYIHRDLKPENIIIGSRGARLLDFGLAKALQTSSPDVTQIGTIVGTPHYMAPEQILLGSAVDHRVDIYAFGVIAYEMLVGYPPFVGERRAIEYQHQVVRPASVAEIRSVIPATLDQLVRACLAKQPDARPQSAAELRDALASSLAGGDTLIGSGVERAKSASAAHAIPSPAPRAPDPKAVGAQVDVALAWIVGGDLSVVTRAVSDTHGIIARQRGEGILAAFAGAHHDSPLTVALTACRDLAHKQCRVVIHMSTALMRRGAQGKPTLYGQDLERIEGWIPPAAFAGLVLTSAAAARAQQVVPAPDVADFFRERQAAISNQTVFEARPTFVGRASLVARIVEATTSRGVVVGIDGDPGCGKTRLVEELSDKLPGRDVIAFRARRTFLGDQPDDSRVLHALAGQPTADPDEAIAKATLRRAVLIIDDVDRLSRSLLERLLRPMPLARVFTSSQPLFEVSDDDEERLAITLPRLAHQDSEDFLREQLRPARLIPNVLIERLALRGAGNPRLMFALVRDMKRTDAIRRHAGSDEWYVAVDQLDTLMAPPSASWLAVRALEDLPPEIAPILRVCSALGPRFSAAEVAAVSELSNATPALTFLMREGFLIERNNWYEFDAQELQDALYAHVDSRDTVHRMALAYWLGHPTANRVGWLARIAYHAATGDRETSLAATLGLARAAHRRGDLDGAESLLAHAHSMLAPKVAPIVLEVIDGLQDE